MRLMQPDAQTTSRGFLAVSEDALEIAIVIQGAVEVLSLYLFTIYFVYASDNLQIFWVIVKTKRLYVWCVAQLNG